MPEAVAKRLTDLTGLAYVEGYGLTETMAPSHINPPQRPKRQCLGIPIFGVDARVVDPVTLAELGLGEVGEIVTHGPQVFQGYWRNPEATHAAFVEIDGKRFFRTGDLGRYDEDGYFFLVDRLKRMINAAGMKVWPAEVEATMHAHPDILEACIIAAKDERRGETVKAVIALKPERRGKVGAEQIIAWCREHMAQPVVVQGGVAHGPPVYLHVPPGHAKHWPKHCAKYGACAQPVYFVQDGWYNDVYVPTYARGHGKGKGPKHKDD
jgi:fatty-acyl-CoA synthase